MQHTLLTKELKVLMAVLVRKLQQDTFMSKSESDEHVKTLKSKHYDFYYHFGANWLTQAY